MIPTQPIRVLIDPFTTWHWFISSFRIEVAIIVKINEQKLIEMEESQN